MIQIKITKYNFEHDLYALVRSFYPGAETQVEVLPGNGEEISEPGDIGIQLEMGKSPESRYISIQLENGKTLMIELEEAYAYERMDRISLKTYVKRKVYEALSGETGRKLAWGTLTGIRPTKLAMEQLEMGCSVEETEEFLKNHYLVSSGKASLCVEIALRERKELDKLDYRNGYSLYIGIPFCPTRCLYCSFTSYPIDKWKNQVDSYVDALCKELRYVAGAMENKGKILDTVYMGGGTPTTLSALQMDRVLTECEDAFHFRMKDCMRPLSEGVNRMDGMQGPMEFTVEAGRPDSITREKLQVIYDHGIRRISINPQTMQQRTLDLIGRRHTVEDVVEAFYMAREMGFTNINMDLIVGLPGETYEDVFDTMERMKELHPDSLTVHSLAIKRAARLNTMREAYADYRITNTQEIIDMTLQGAREMGLLPYYLYRQKNMAGNFENVGYAEVDKAGIYNILIMEEKQTIVACGAGGSTKWVIPEENRIERIENVKDVGQYIARIDEMIERKKQWL